MGCSRVEPSERRGCGWAVLQNSEVRGLRTKAAVKKAERERKFEGYSRAVSDMVDEAGDEVISQQRLKKILSGLLQL